MTNVINVRDLDIEDVAIVEKLVERLRKKTKLKRESGVRKADGFKRSAGSWNGLIDSDTLIRNIYADRLIITRPEAKL